MIYTPVYPGGWKNKPDPTTPIDADALDHIEDGLAAVTEAVGSGAQAAAGPLLFVMRQNVRDAYVLHIGDSRADGRDGAGGPPINETWELIADMLGAKFPDHSVVEYRLSSNGLGGYDAPTTRQTGTSTANAGGPFTLYIYNGQFAGSDWSHPLTTADTHWRTLPQGQSPDLITFAHGRNENTVTLLERIFMGVEPLRVRHPQAGVIVCSEIPSTDTGTNAANGALRAQQTVKAAQMMGAGWIDFYNPIANDPRGVTALLQSDGVHPNADGNTVCATAAWSAMWSEQSQPHALVPSSLEVPGRQLLVNNPDFSVPWDGTGAPPGWLKTSNVALAKDTVNVETGSYGLQMTQVANDSTYGEIHRYIDVRGYQGRRITASVRMLIPTAYTSRITAGLLILTCGSVSTMSRGWLGNCPQGRFIWNVLSIDVPVNATFCLLTIYADHTPSSGAGTSITVDRVSVTPGAQPRDLASPLPSTSAGLPSVTPIDPATLTPLRYHDAADLSALADGAAVTTWADRSTAANPLTPGTAGPVYGATALNGKPGVAFAKVSGQVMSGTTSTSTAQPYTLQMVLQPADVTATRVIWTTPNAALQIRLDGPQSGVAVWAVATGSNFAYGPPVLSGIPVTVGVVFDGTTSELWINGFKQTLTGLSGLTNTQNFVQEVLGNNLTVTNAISFDGPVSVVAAFAAHHSATQLAGVAEFLLGAYGLTLVTIPAPAVPAAGALGSAASHPATDFAPAGAYVKPGSGIPAADLTTTAQGQLTKAGTSVQTVNGTSPDGSGNVAISTGSTVTKAAVVGTGLAAADIGAAPAYDTTVTPTLDEHTMQWNPTSSKWGASLIPAALDARRTCVPDSSPTGGGTNNATALAALFSQAASEKREIKLRGMYRSATALTHSYRGAVVIGADHMNDGVYFDAGGLKLGDGAAVLAGGGQISYDGPGSLLVADVMIYGTKSGAASLTSGLTLDGVPISHVNRVLVSGFDIGFDMVNNCGGTKFDSIKSPRANNLGMLVRATGQSGSDITVHNGWMHGLYGAYCLDGATDLKITDGQANANQQGTGTTGSSKWDSTGAIIVGRSWGDGTTGSDGLPGTINNGGVSGNLFVQGVDLEGTRGGYCAMRSYGFVNAVFMNNNYIGYALSAGAVGISPAAYDGTDPGCSGLVKMTGAGGSTLTVTGGSAKGTFQSRALLNLSGSAGFYLETERVEGRGGTIIGGYSNGTTTGGNLSNNGATAVDWLGTQMTGSSTSVPTNLARLSQVTVPYTSRVGGMLDLNGLWQRNNSGGLQISSDGATWTTLS